jgi:methylenetetrahydrofolate reductase (NADPH)
MRFAEIFRGAQKPVISFEVFPPKTQAALESLLALLPRLVALRPDFMTVTYGAMGTTRVRTAEIAALIRRQFGMECASHLTCVGSKREEIERQLEDLGRAGIENIVALRGDPPSGETSFVAVEGGYRHAVELVGHIRRQGGFGVAVAGYPEKHIEAPDMETDLRHLRTKVETGADLVITQLFYDNADYLRFVDRVRALGVGVPVVPGLLPIQSYPQIQKITALCGAKIPAELRRRLEAASEAEGPDEGAVRRVGADWTLEQCRGLLRAGAPGIHFYVLNRASHVESILGALRDEQLIP